MGSKPPYKSLERLNNDGDYTPKNCVWASDKQQRRNTCRNVYIRAAGKTMCLTDWCVALAVTRQAYYYHTRNGLAPAQAIKRLLNA